jgi:hypothetical protein
MHQDQISDTWILQLRAVRRVHLTFTSEFSMETHILEFAAGEAEVSKPARL